MVHTVFATKNRPLNSLLCDGLSRTFRNPLASFLTPTALMYAFGAGITLAPRSGIPSN